jgi:hypothetical protein
MYGSLISATAALRKETTYSVFIYLTSSSHDSFKLRHCLGGWNIVYNNNLLSVHLSMLI